MGNEFTEVLTEPLFSRPGIINGEKEEPLIGIYETSSDQKYALGTLLEYNDGRAFQYARAGAIALVKAYMTSAEAVDAKLIDELQGTSGTSVEVGDYEITVDITTGITLAEDELADGILVVNKATGMGDVYKIRASKVQSTDTLLDILLETPIRTAWAADTEITISKHPCWDVVVTPTTRAGIVTGVPLVAVTANYWCWLQVRGLTPLYVDTSETLIVGHPAGFPGTPNVAGAIGDIEAATDEYWGTPAAVATEAEVALIDLKIR